MSSVAGLPDNTSLTAVPPGATGGPADPWMSEITHLLHELQTVSTNAATLPPVMDHPQADNQLIQVRLGLASALFTTLQYKHAATAGHSLRVALTASAWAVRMQLPAEQRDVLEVAALLHDVGIVGVPDQILCKPNSLDSDETTLIGQTPQMSVEILGKCCASQELLEVVGNVHAWYNGALKGFQRSGEQIPLGARMISIVEAFDAMTTDHVYRPAMSQEAAMVELFECAGTQFDPALVRQFAEYHLYDQSDLHREVAGRWLRDLDPALVNSYWQLNCVPSQAGPPLIESVFQSKLLDNMYDAVVFVDGALQILAWNNGMERLTGVPGNSMRQQLWCCETLKMCDEKGRPVKELDCPVRSAVQSGVQSLRRMTIAGRGGRPIAVDTHAIPVTAEDGRVQGAILLMHDASSETSLEQRCQALYEKATKDPLTQVANRAEFDRVHEMFLAAHEQQQVPCSMLICDIDRFKSVNDNFGHQAGDDAIKSLASLLKSHCRPGDLVARYGGEEFVMLFADCDNPTATRRAEQIRLALSQLPQPRLDGRAITASFGVTEVQPGDTPETMLRRADRGLLMAKGKGRNCVVQLGSGSNNAPVPAEEKPKWSWWSRKPAGDACLIRQDLISAVPIKIAVEKLRGFVADHQAKIAKIDGNNLRLEISDAQDSWNRRRSDRPVSFFLDVRFEEEQLQKEDGDPAKDVIIRTRIQVGVTPCKTRDRRRSDIEHRAREVLVSFRSYLMANEATAENQPGMLRRVKRILSPWGTAH